MGWDGCAMMVLNIISMKTGSNARTVEEKGRVSTLSKVDKKFPYDQPNRLRVNRVEYCSYTFLCCFVLHKSWTRVVQHFVSASSASTYSARFARCCGADGFYLLLFLFCTMVRFS
jgi:hypothetical protein